MNLFPIYLDISIFFKFCFYDNLLASIVRSSFCFMLAIILLFVFLSLLFFLLFLLISYWIHLAIPGVNVICLGFLIFGIGYWNKFIVFLCVNSHCLLWFRLIILINLCACRSWRSRVLKWFCSSSWCHNILEIAAGSKLFKPVEWREGKIVKFGKYIVPIWSPVLLCNILQFFNVC